MKMFVPGQFAKILIRSSPRDCLSGRGVVTWKGAFKTSGVGVPVLSRTF